MFGHDDLETGQGAAEFEECCKTIRRFILSRKPPCDIDEVVQECITRVLQRLKDNMSFKANAGFFIKVAQNVLLECYRESKKHNQHYKHFFESEDEENSQPIDAKFQYEKYLGQQNAAAYNECLLECFNKQELEIQVFIYNYVMQDDLLLDSGETKSSDETNFNFLDSIREILETFIPFQDKYKKIEKNRRNRVKITRIRRKLRECLLDCLSRKNLSF